MKVLLTSVALLSLILVISCTKGINSIADLKYSSQSVSETEITETGLSDIRDSITQLKQLKIEQTNVGAIAQIDQMIEDLNAELEVKAAAFVQLKTDVVTVAQTELEVLEARGASTAEIEAAKKILDEAVAAQTVAQGIADDLSGALPSSSATEGTASSQAGAPPADSSPIESSPSESSEGGSVQAGLSSSAVALSSATIDASSAVLLSSISEPLSSVAGSSAIIVSSAEVVSSVAVSSSSVVVSSAVVSSSSAAQSSATVSSSVVINTAPYFNLASPVIASVNEDAFVDIVLVGTDDENNTLIWMFVDDAGGAATISGVGDTKIIRYTPPTDFNGTESLVVRISDSEFDVSITLDLTVNPVADPTDYSGTPSIAGTLDVSETLIITPGTCTDPDAAVSWTYQWYRDDDTAPGGGASIAGATSISYDLVSDDATKWLYAEVTCNAEIKTTAHTISAINGSAVGNDEFLPGTGTPTNVTLSSKAIFNTDGGTLCWSGADMTGKTTASIRYSNGEVTGDQLLLKVGAVIIASFNTDNCLVGGAWEGDCATISQSIIPVQTGTQTICLEAHNSSGSHSGAITWLKLE